MILLLPIRHGVRPAFLSSLAQGAHGSNHSERIPFWFGASIHKLLARVQLPQALGIAVRDGMGDGRRHVRQRHKKTKELMAAKLIKRAEDIIPRLSNYIDVQEVATPLTMERYTGNYKGAIYGWAPLISQTGFRRMDSKTPIKNLYLAGHGLDQGAEQLELCILENQ